MTQVLTPDRSIVLIGLMGVGKTTVGRRLSKALGLKFRDADEEVEKAAGRSVAEIFKDFGEAAFRDGERKVIARLLEEPPMVLALGGGAFVDPDTRAKVLNQAVSVWLKADVDTLMNRVSRRDTRPLLQDPNPRAVLERLLE
ncbi:MAG: shikimate kinase, partial [Alphaproteobacteria bacterium]|nr:shikimate kinase [Alphaproteobacteria bacterium]